MSSSCTATITINGSLHAPCMHACTSSFCLAQQSFLSCSDKVCTCLEQLIHKRRASTDWAKYRHTCNIYIYIWLHNKEETEIIIRSNESRVHSHHTFLHHHANHANLLVATKFTRNVNSPIYALIYKGQIESWWYWWIINATTYQQV